MRIVIAGGTGFVGQALVKHFLAKGYEIVVIGRDKNKIQETFGERVTAFPWEDFTNHGKDLIIGSDFVINLAGANIAQKRWTKERKEEIIQSRVVTTKTIADMCATLGKVSPPLFNASAVGIYGLQEPIENSLPKSMAEDDAIDFDNSKDFVSHIVKEWEKATHHARDQGVRVVNMRFAVVLDKKGALAKLKTPFSLGLGGPVGTGEQPFSWIALTDLISAIDFLIEKPSISGPVNFVAPQCVSQGEFASTFASILDRPAFFTTPAFLIKKVFGEMGEELLLNGQCAYPKVLLTNGFEFAFPRIEEALKHIYQ